MVEIFVYLVALFTLPIAEILFEIIVGFDQIEITVDYGGVVGHRLKQLAVYPIQIVGFFALILNLVCHSPSFPKI
jgi:hypothetical protein